MALKTNVKLENRFFTQKKISANKIFEKLTYFVQICTK